MAFGSEVLTGEERALLAMPGMGYLASVLAEKRKWVFDTFGMSIQFKHYYCGVLEDAEVFDPRALENLSMVVVEQSLAFVPREKMEGLAWQDVMSVEPIFLDLGGETVLMDDMHVGEPEFVRLGAHCESLDLSGDDVYIEGSEPKGFYGAFIKEESVARDAGTGTCYSLVFPGAVKEAVVQSLKLYPTLSALIKEYDEAGSGDAWVLMMPRKAYGALVIHMVEDYVVGAVQFSEYVRVLRGTKVAEVIVVGGPGAVKEGVGVPRGIVAELESLGQRMSSLAVATFAEMDLEFDDKGQGGSSRSFYDGIVCDVLQGKLCSMVELNKRVASVEKQNAYMDKGLLVVMAYGIGKRAGTFSELAHWSTMSKAGKIWHALCRADAFLNGGFRACTVVMVTRGVSLDFERTGTGVLSVGLSKPFRVASSYVYVPRGCTVKNPRFAVEAGDAPLLLVVERGVTLRVSPPRGKVEVEIVVVNMCPWWFKLWNGSMAVPDYKSSEARMFRDCGAELLVLLQVDNQRVDFPLRQLDKVKATDDDDAESVSEEVVTYELPLGAVRGLPSWLTSSVLMPRAMFSGGGVSRRDDLPVELGEVDKLELSSGSLRSGNVKVQGGTILGFSHSCGGTITFEGPPRLASCVVVCMGDTYSFDRGGPSGSDFSDGY